MSDNMNNKQQEKKTSDPDVPEFIIRKSNVTSGIMPMRTKPFSYKDADFERHPNEYSGSRVSVTGSPDYRYLEHHTKQGSNSSNHGFQSDSAAHVPAPALEPSIHANIDPRLLAEQPRTPIQTNPQPMMPPPMTYQECETKEEFFDFYLRSEHMTVDEWQRRAAQLDAEREALNMIYQCGAIRSHEIAYYDGLGFWRDDEGNLVVDRDVIFGGDTPIKWYGPEDSDMEDADSSPKYEYPDPEAQQSAF